MKYTWIRRKCDHCRYCDTVKTKKVNGAENLEAHLMDVGLKRKS